MECIFCKIVTKEISSSPIYEDGEFIVIPDKFPKAHVHILLIPKVHLSSVKEAGDNQVLLLGKILLLAKKIAADLNISDYKLILNNGKYAEVPHLHLHLISGEMSGQV